MTEVKTPPIVGTDHDGDPTYTFTAQHSFADVARWIISEGGREEVLYFLNQMEDA